MRRIARAVLASSAAVGVASVLLFRLSPGQAPLLAPVVLAFLGAGLTLLSLRARDRVEQYQLEAERGAEYVGSSQGV